MNVVGVSDLRVWPSSEHIKVTKIEMTPPAWESEE